MEEPIYVDWAITNACNQPGTIGGGCVERALKDLASLALEKKERTRSVELRLEGEERGGIGMKCGGKIEVFVETFVSSQ